MMMAHILIILINYVFKRWREVLYLFCR